MYNVYIVDKIDIDRFDTITTTDIDYFSSMLFCEENG